MQADVDEFPITSNLLGLLGPGEFNYAYNVSFKNKYVYIENAKAACTSVKHSLGQLEFCDSDLGDEIPRQYLDNVHTNVVGTPFIKPFQLTQAVLEWLLASRVLVFTFVRNPFTRVLSAYLDKIVNEFPESLEVSEEWEGKPGRDISFEEFLVAIERRMSRGVRLDKHWRPQYIQCGAGGLRVDCIGRFEYIEEDFEMIMKRIGRAGKKLSRVSPHATNAETRIEEFYDGECAERVRRIYRMDFERFGYSNALKGECAEVGAR